MQTLAKGVGASWREGLAADDQAGFAGGPGARMMDLREDGDGTLGWKGFSGVVLLQV